VGIGRLLELATAARLYRPPNSGFRRNPIMGATSANCGDTGSGQQARPYCADRFVAYSRCVACWARARSRGL